MGACAHGKSTAISSQTLVLSKWSASAAGLDGNAGVSSNKRQRVKNKPVKKTIVQNGRYAAAKFSDSFSISHVVNLLVAGEYI